MELTKRELLERRIVQELNITNNQPVPPPQLMVTMIANFVEKEIKNASKQL